MANDSISQLRLQLLSRGYKIIPNIGKIPAVAGWNSQDYLDRELQPIGPKGTLADRVARWPRRWPQAQTTGLRIEGGLVVLDLDIDDEEMIGLVLDQLPDDVASHGPTRYGSGAKVAVFAQLAAEEAPFVRMVSRRYQGHCIEVFGGAKLSGDRCSRQFGIYGPHSPGIEYLWAEGVPALHEINAADLPVISLKQIAVLIDDFETTARDAGWQPDVAPVTDAGEVLYDITSVTRFDTNRGETGLDYNALCEAFAVYGEGLRVSSNFIPGRGDSGRTDHCMVGDQNRHGVVGVWVHGDEALHLPARDGIDIEELACSLREAAAIAGQDIPITAPNWRECYAGTTFPKPSLHNTRLAIEALRIHCSRDTFHNQMWMGRSDAAAPSERLAPFFGAVTDISLGSLRIRLSETFGLDFTEKHVRDAAITLCEENQFNPVVEMLAEAETNWDGKHRLSRMAVEHFNTADTTLNRQMVRKTMIGAVARARRPGCKFDTILTMESAEGWNKSSAWAVLAGDDNFSDASILGHNGREVQEQLADIWIHENAELAGMKKAEAETIKAFASRQVDRARPAYGRFLVKQPRHSIEVGTTNGRQYLQSPTGNRRFWPIEVLAPIDLRKLREARQQLWGEAAHYQSQGEELTLEEALWAAAGDVQEERRVQHPWEALIDAMMVIPTSGHLGGGSTYGLMVIHRIGVADERVHTADIYQHVLGMQGHQMHRGHALTLQEIMQRKGWTHKPNMRIENRQGAGYTRQKVT